MSEGARSTPAEPLCEQLVCVRATLARAQATPLCERHVCMCDTLARAQATPPPTPFARKAWLAKCVHPPPPCAYLTHTLRSRSPRLARLSNDVLLQSSEAWLRRVGSHVRHVILLPNPRRRRHPPRVHPPRRVRRRGESCAGRRRDQQRYQRRNRVEGQYQRTLQDHNARALGLPRDVCRPDGASGQHSQGASELKTEEDAAGCPQASN